MKKWLRRVGIVLGVLVGLVLLGLGAAYATTSARLAETHTAEFHPFAQAGGDPLEGGRLAELYGCTECHGANLGGTLLIDGMPFARVPAPNLTAGRAGGALTDEQWEISVRHGVGTDGRALAIMPSPEYVYLSDKDLADIVAWVRTLPAVSDGLPPRALGPVGWVMMSLGQVPLATELMPPGARHAAAVAKDAPTPELGEYLTRLCTGCHGADLAGAPTGQPGAPPAPNLTPGGNLAGWSVEQFKTAMRTGQTPDGRALDPAFMPWTAIGKASDTELDAMWTYLSGLAAVEREL